MRHERAIPVTAEFEIRSTDKGHLFTGYAAVFGAESAPLPYIETVAPGAFARSLTMPPNGRQTFVVDHDDAKLLSSTRSGRLHLVRGQQGPARRVGVARHVVRPRRPRARRREGARRDVVRVQRHEGRRAVQLDGKRARQGGAALPRHGPDRQDAGVRRDDRRRPRPRERRRRRLRRRLGPLRRRPRGPPPASTRWSLLERVVASVAPPTPGGAPPPPTPRAPPTRCRASSACSATSRTTRRRPAT
jgi:hypothetical protein